MDYEKLRAYLLGNLGLNKSVAENWLSRVSPSEENRPENFVSPAALRQNKAENEVYLYGVIVDAMEQAWIEGWLGEGLTVSNTSFRNELNDISGDVVIRIDSPGGSVWQTSGIIAAITERQKAGDTITARIDGLAASGASLVAVIPSHVAMAPLSHIMIHQSHSWAFGTSTDLRKSAELLEKTDNQQVSIYSKRLSKSRNEIMKLLSEETWFSPEEALEAGLVDELVEIDVDANAQHSGVPSEKEVKELLDRRKQNAKQLYGLAI